MSATVGQFITAVRSEVGYLEQSGNRTKFAAEAGHFNGQAWCLTFAVAVARRVRLLLPPGVVETAYTPTAANAFKRAKRWVQPADIEPGDWVFFDFPDSKRRIQHMGIAVEATRRSWLRLGRRVVRCVEGNTSSGIFGSQDNGGGVFERTRPLSHAVGAGRPYFATPVEEDEMTPAQAKMLEELHAAFFKGVPSYGVPPLRDAVVDTAYQVAGIDLPGKPSLLRRVAAAVKVR